MSLSALENHIESHDFGARLGIANNLPMLQELADQDLAVQELAKLLRDHSAAAQLVTRMTSLIREQEDFRLRNPHDSAIAIYLLLLNRVQPALAKLVATTAINAPRLWWARLAASRITVGESSKEVGEHSHHELVEQKGDWRSGGTLGRKSVLIVSEPPEGLIRDGKILDGSDLSVIKTSPDSENHILNYSTETPTRTRVVSHD